MPNKSKGNSFRKLDCNKSLTGDKLFSNVELVKDSIVVSKTLAKASILSTFGNFFPFSISFKYEIDNPLSFDNSAKDNPFSLRKSLIFNPKIIFLF